MPQTARSYFWRSVLEAICVECEPSLPSFIHLGNGIMRIVLFALALFVGVGCARETTPETSDSMSVGVKPNRDVAASDAASPLVSSSNDAAAPGALKVIKVKDVDTRWHWIPPGNFKMGSPTSEKGHSNLEPQVEATISKGFWMLETEVTQELWTAVMGTKLGWESESGLSPKHPAYALNYMEATDFCEKLNALLKSTPDAAGMSVSLPTEAQWEYAARAGTSTSYYWGEDEAQLDDNAWHHGNSNFTTHPVGLKKGNAWGLMDMPGNVSEWCIDWLVPEPTGGTDPIGTTQQPFGRAVRGGCWYFEGENCRSAHRSAFEPESRYDYLGFRLSLR